MYNRLQPTHVCMYAMHDDGPQMNDTRMGLTVALTATQHGAVLANRVKVMDDNECRLVDRSWVDGWHPDVPRDFVVREGWTDGRVLTDETLMLMQVVKLLKDEKGELCGARVQDTLTNEQWDVRAKVHTRTYTHIHFYAYLYPYQHACTTFVHVQGGGERHGRLRRQHSEDGRPGGGAADRAGGG